MRAIARDEAAESDGFMNGGPLPSLHYLANRPWGR
jgi:hypothetical protein